MVPRLIDDTPCSVYLLYDAQDALLYVGITSRSTRRLGEHYRDKDWWPEVARAEFKHYPAVALARHAEAILIRDRQPRHNVVAPYGRGREQAPAMPRVVDREEYEESLAMQRKRSGPG